MVNIGGLKKEQTDWLNLTAKLTMVNIGAKEGTDRLTKPDC